MSIINKVTGKAGILSLFLLGVIAITGSTSFAAGRNTTKPTAKADTTKSAKTAKKKVTKKKKQHNRKSSMKSAKKS